MNLKRWMETVDRLAGLGLSCREAMALRRVEMTLHRWACLECGNGNDFGSWAIERDEATDIPYMVHHHYRHGQGQDITTRTRIPDREAGALRRLAAIMATHKRRLVAYHQSDPRGCSLYIVRRRDVPKGETVDAYYTRGLAVCD